MASYVAVIFVFLQFLYFIWEAKSDDNYEVTIDFHCGGKNIGTWDDGKDANYGRLRGISNCERLCDMHVECAGFVYLGFDDTCSSWKRGPLNVFSYAGRNCHKKIDGLTQTHHSKVLGTYEQDGFSNGRISYKLKGKKIYLYYNSDFGWMVSDIKRSTKGWLSSSCKEECPFYCGDSWKTFDKVDNPWKNDKTLTLKYTLTPDYTYCQFRACKGRNELFTGNVPNRGACKYKCDDNNQCVSFEWDGSSTCQLSSSCTYELSDEYKTWDLYMKDATLIEGTSTVPTITNTNSKPTALQTKPSNSSIEFHTSAIPGTTQNDTVIDTTANSKDAIIGIALGGTIALIIAIIVAILMMKKKKSKNGKKINKSKQKPEKEDDGYDMEPMAGANRNSGDIYGDIDEDVDFQVIQNPYYDGEIKMSPLNTNNARKTTNLKDTEAVTVTHNIYYE